MSQTTPQPGDRGLVSVTLPQDRDLIDELEGSIMAALDREGYPKPSAFAIRLAFEEAVINAFKHGHRDLPEEAEIRVEFRVDPVEVFLAVEDQGPGFTPEAVPDPTLDENLEATSGRGMMLIRAYMTEVTHSASGSRVEMRYRRPNDD